MSITEEQCEQFKKNPHVNPVTRRSIQINGPTYRELTASCKKLEQMLNSNITRMNIDNLLDIASRLNYYELINLCQTNKFFSSLCRTERFSRLIQDKIDESVEQTITYLQYGNTTNTPTPIYITTTNEHITIRAGEDTADYYGNEYFTSDDEYDLAIDSGSPVYYVEFTVRETLISNILNIEDTRFRCDIKGMLTDSELRKVLRYFIVNGIEIKAEKD